MEDRSHARDALTRMESELKPLLDLSPVATVIADLEGQVVAWNSCAEQLFGYTCAEALGKDLDELVSTTGGVDRDATRSAQPGLEMPDRQTFARGMRKDGSFVDVERIVAPVLVDGEMVGHLAVYHDVSELQRQRRYYEELLEASPAAIVGVDPEDNVTSWNRAAEQLFGYSRSEAIGRNIDELVSGDDDDQLHDAKRFSEDSKSHGAARKTTQRTRKDGSLVDVDVVGAPIYVGDELVGQHAIYHDISEIQRQKQYFETLVNAAPVAIGIFDRDAIVRLWNPAAEKLFGYTADEAIGSHLDDLIANSDEIRAEALAYTQDALAGEPLHHVTRRTRKDGTLVDVEFQGVPLRFHGEHIGQYFIYHDISELQRQKQYFETLVEASPVAVVLHDADAIVRLWNPAAESLFGYTAAEAIGRNIDDLVATSEEIRAEAEAFTRQFGATNRAITRRTRKDGTLVDVELLDAPLMFHGEYLGQCVLYHDISELQEARTEAEAAAQAKSVFLATMSHEIRTPLNAVLGMTELLLDTELARTQREYAEVVRSSGEALLAVIDEILDFSKVEAGKLELERRPFDLRQCIDSALELVARTAAEKELDLAYVVDRGAPAAIVGDATRLRQVLLNLLNNALKFTERGEVDLSVEVERIDQQADGATCRLHFAVRDSGIGIPADRMDRLFESFSQIDASTTRRFGGTGLGLAISRRLVELMGGAIWAESTEGEGSTFHFTLTAPTSPAPLPAYAQGAPPQLDGRRVLIVDDNSTNREILRRQAASWGMQTRDTALPRQALEWVVAGESFDVALLDMQMPELDGLSLARQIRLHASSEQLPLVLLSSLGSHAHTDVNALFAAQLAKPVRPSQLYDALLEVFGPTDGPADAADRAPRIDTGMAERLPLRILVAEDNPVNQHLALLLLERMGYRADVVSDGEEAVAALARERYDIVLMDVQMPAMDGLEATRQIRVRESNGVRPWIIAMTANALEGDREMCLATGMNDYISKPIRAEALAAALRASRPSVPAVESEPLDQRALDSLRDAVGGAESLKELIEVFLRDSLSLVEELRAAVEANHVEDVRRHAHTLKSTAETFGAQPLAEVCRRVESAATAAQLDGASAAIGEIEAQLGRVHHDLNLYRTHGGSVA